ncbi:hydroxymethylglutaryl-CoA lyase [Pseudidiomarina gelatinasegens]|uniref:hydroxymethylglutaryl-CoA lyase n=1 Tax=Pseudidiomarina gelatinasegens TaxID=2487740 RepID=UPI003A97D4A3
MSEWVTINEVGPRDGLQSLGKVLTVEQRLQLIQGLVDCGIAAIESTSFVSAKAVPQMAGATELYRQLPNVANVRYAALVPNLRGYNDAVAAGARTVNVVLSVTDTMNLKNINMSLEQTAQVCSDIMKQAKADGVNGQAYLAVAFECPFEGAVSTDVVTEFAKQMYSAGAQKIIIADTIGAANPARVITLLTQIAKVLPLSQVACHFHDTRGMALANVYAALQCGVREFDTAIGGMGGCPFSPGASGNMATEDAVLMLEQMGYKTGISLHELTAVIGTVEGLVERKLGGHSYNWLKRQYLQNNEQGAHCG